MTGPVLVPFVLTLVRAPFTSGDTPTITSDVAFEEVKPQSHSLVQVRSLADEASGVVRQAIAAPLPTASARVACLRSRAEASLDLGLLTRRRQLAGHVEGASSPKLSTPDDHLVSEALERRIEVAGQRAQERAAAARVRSAWARFAPQLSASREAFFADEPCPMGGKDGLRMGLDFTKQLCDGGFRYGELRQAEAQVRCVQAGLRAHQLSVHVHPQARQRDRLVAIEQLRPARAQVELASDNAASIGRSYGAGVASSLDVIDASDRTHAADTGLGAARIRLAQSRLDLQLALGSDR